jgi:selenocysteine-specific elongation factor
MPLHHVIVGTAGHIDHGKTSLVKALTGIDADRLEEEKRRGITIDLGFADVHIGETHFAFIDVPGHEKFVRNMLAGVGGIDIVLLVVAADEGVMPQTREHFEICKLLGIKHGVVAITKTDVVDSETLLTAKEGIRDLVRGSFMQSAPVISVSSLTGENLEELRRAIWQISQTLQKHDEAGVTRLPIDRVFTMKGFGTVITGTLIAGLIKKDDELEVHPSGRRVRVRNIQVHGTQTNAARAGQRTAINLVGAEKSDLDRGMMLTEPGKLQTTSLVDAELTLLADANVQVGTKVHLHSYSAETVATVKQLANDLGRLKLDMPLQLVANDRFILRRFSPVTTIGGGTLLDPAPSVREKLQAEAARDLHGWIRSSGEQGLTLTDLVARSGRRQNEVTTKLNPLLESQTVIMFGDTYFAAIAADALRARAEQSVRDFHTKNRLASGMNADELRGLLHLQPGAFAALLGTLQKSGVLVHEGTTVKLRGAGVQLEDAEAKAMQEIVSAFASAGLKVPALPEVISGLKIPRDKAVKIVTLLLRDRTLIKLGDDLVFHKDALAALRPMLAAHKTRTGKSTIDVAQFKDLAGVSRKYAIPLLEHLDRDRVTRREGNLRVIL